MKLVLATVVLGAFLSTQAVSAAEEAHPCLKIKEACEAAGFKPDESKQKNGLMMNCMKPILNGKKVKDINVTDAEIAACKEKRGSHHYGNKHMNQNMNEHMNENMNEMHKDMHNDNEKSETKAEEKK